MPKFYAKDTFEIPDLQLFAIAGAILEGEFKSGMFVHIPVNASVATIVRIHSIELARRHEREDICLCIESETELAAFLGSLNIGGEILEVSTEGSD